MIYSKYIKQAVENDYLIFHNKTTYWTEGYGGQFLIIIPEQNIIIRQKEIKRTFNKEKNEGEIDDIYKMILKTEMLIE